MTDRKISTFTLFLCLASTIVKIFFAICNIWNLKYFGFVDVKTKFKYVGMGVKMDGGRNRITVFYTSQFHQLHGV